MSQHVDCSHRTVMSLALAVAVCLICEPVESQLQKRGHDSLVIGTTAVTLRMTESDVLKRLSSQFDTRNHSVVGPNSSWQVCEKNSQAAAPCLGSIVFENGRLVEASRRWPEPGTASDLAKSLHTIAARLVSEGHSSCRLDVIVVRDRFSTDDSTLMICGAKQLRIGFISPDPTVPPYVVEVLQSTDE
jgi:hypothetical protein